MPDVDVLTRNNENRINQKAGVLITVPKGNDCSSIGKPDSPADRVGTVAPSMTRPRSSGCRRIISADGITPYTQHHCGKRDPGWPPTPIANDQLHQRGDYDYANESTEGHQSGCPPSIPQEPFAGSNRSANLNQPLVGDSNHGESNVETQKGLRRGQVEAAQNYHESPDDENHPGSHPVDQIAAERSKSGA